MNRACFLGSINEKTLHLAGLDGTLWMFSFPFFILFILPIHVNKGLL